MSVISSMFKLTHSSILAWRIPRTEEPGGLQSMGSQRVGHDWVTNTAAAAAASLQSCLPLCDPIDSSPPGSPIPGILQQEYWSRLPFPSPMHESEKWKWGCSVQRLLCPTLSDPMDCSLLGSFVHGIFTNTLNYLHDSCRHFYDMYMPRLSQLLYVLLSWSL